MDGRALFCFAGSGELFSFSRDLFEHLLQFCSRTRTFDLARQCRYGGGNSTDKLDGRPVAVVDVGSLRMKMNNRSLFPLIPNGRPEFDRIVADGDDEISDRQKLIAGLIVRLPDAPCKAVELSQRDGAC